MTKLAEIQSAIMELTAVEREALRMWLERVAEHPALLAAIDEADRSFPAEGGVLPEEIRRKFLVEGAPDFVQLATKYKGMFHGPPTLSELGR